MRDPEVSGIGTRGGIPGRLRSRLPARGDRTALVGNKACRDRTVTFAALFAEVERLAAGLLDLGLAAGDRIGLVGDNCDVWLVTDLALLSFGAVDVPRGGDASAAEVAFCVTHAGCRAAVVENAAQARKLGDARTGLEWVLVLKGEAPEGTIPLDDVLRRGDALLSRDPEAVRRRAAEVGNDDLATIIYTSGTTGNPKGVMLTHGNMLHNIRMVPEVLHLREGHRFLSFLPVWHSFERIIDYVCLDAGLELHYSSKWTLKEDFLRVRPHFVCGVPRLWETYYNGVMSALEKKPPAVRRFVHSMLECSRVRAAALRKARALHLTPDGAVARPTAGARLAAAVQAVLGFLPHLLADRLVYRRLRDAFGGRVMAMVSGGGPLPAHVDEFFVRAGLPLLNGYGLTESSPVISVRRPERNLLGSIGPPCPETEVRIVDDSGAELGCLARGVIQARGPQIMQGYWKNEAATARALPGGGWLDTGDVGMISSAGDLVITGRAKDTLVLMGGENVEPEPIEAAITSSPYIVEALVVGHGQKTLAALLVPDAAALRAHLGLAKDVPDVEVFLDPRTESRLREEVAARISKASGYRSFEMIGRVHVLDRPFSVDDGTLTPTFKKKRSVIEVRYQQIIAGLFS